MMPAVTVRSSPKGLPMAIAHCPTRRRSESPSSATGNEPEGVSIRSTARSVLGSRPTRVALNLRSSERPTSISAAFSTTWALVRTKPCLSTITPEPEARPSSRGERLRKKRSKNSCPKNSLKRSSISGPPGTSAPAGPRLAFTVTFTTAGITRSATATKALSSASSTRTDSGADTGGVWARLASGAPSATMGTRARTTSARRHDVIMDRPPRAILLWPRGHRQRRDECHLEDTPGGVGDGRRAPAAQPRDPDDVAAGLDDRHARAPPARHAGVDEKGLEAPLARRAPRQEAIAGPPRAHGQPIGQTVGVERRAVRPARGLPAGGTVYAARV